MSACAEAHTGHTKNEMAWRSKPEGIILMLARLVRRRKASVRTADDAVLTLKILESVTQTSRANITDREAFARANAWRGTGVRLS